MSAIISQRTARFQQATQSVFEFFMMSTFARRGSDPNVSNFAVGNPQDMPLPAFVDAVQKWSVPQNKDWFGYKMNERAAQQAVVDSLLAWRGVQFELDDIFMTTGAFAALAVAINAITDPGDEVIFISPPWFFYEALIVAADAVPVRVKCHPAAYGLDLDAIAAAITPKTRAIIINSPNNPTGVIYPPEELQALGELLTTASQRNNRPIYLLSDEAYSRIIYNGAPYHSPTSYYPNSMLLYTYGKVLLTPGQRIGYIALPPTMPDRDALRMSLFGAQIMTGYAFPNALLQHALGDLDKASIDIAHLERKRDRVVAALRDMGYEVHVPQGTFYLLPRSPWADDVAFTELLTEYDIFVLPGNVVEMPGYFRISLTASDAMIDRALPGFASAIERAKAAQPAG